MSRALKLSNVSKIMVAFSPFSADSTSARTFLARVSTDRAKATNNKCEVKADIKADNATPLVTVNWADGVVQTIPTKGMLIAEVMEEFQSGFERFPEELDA